MKHLLKSIGKQEIANVIALVVIFGTFGILILQHFVHIPDGNRETVTRATDQMIVLGFAAVIYYFFGGNRKPKQLTNNQNEEQ